MQGPQAGAEFIVAADGSEGPEVRGFCETCRTTLQTCLMCRIDKPVCQFKYQSNRQGLCKACHRNPDAFLARLEQVERSGLLSMAIGFSPLAAT